MKKYFIVFLCLALNGAGPVAGGTERESKTSFSLGATLADGNSKTLLGHVSLVREGKIKRLQSVRTGIEGNYGESTVRKTTIENDEDVEVRETSTTLENARAFGYAQSELSERTFAYLDGSVVYDGIAEIDYRALLGPGLGAYLIKRAGTALSLEIGAAYLWEEVFATRDDYLAVRMGEKFEHELSDTSRIWQSAEFLPKSDDFADYLLNAELGIEAALNTRMNLRFMLQNSYDSTPGGNLKKNDMTFITVISMSL